MKQKNRNLLQTVPVQLKYAVILTLISALMNFLSTFIVAWFVQRNYNLFMGDELGISAQVIEIAHRERQLLELSLLILFVMSIVVSFVASLFVTRKLTGPMMSLERHLVHYGRGDWSRDFRLRKNDEFKELEGIVNDLRRAQLNRG